MTEDEDFESESMEKLPQRKIKSLKSRRKKVVEGKRPSELGKQRQTSLKRRKEQKHGRNDFQNEQKYGIDGT